MRIYCPDCEKKVNVVKDPCPIHENCKDFAYMCDECGSLNVDFEARLKIKEILEK